MRNATIVAARLVLALGSLAIIGCDEDKKLDAPPAPSTSASGAAAAPSASAPAAPKPTMPEMEAASNKLVLDAWNAHDAKKVATAYAADGVLKVPGMPDVKGREAITTDSQLSITAFPDMKLGFSRIWQKGNTQVIEWVVTGTNTGDLNGKKGSGRPIGVAGVSVVTLNDEGLIKEDRRYFDMTTTTSQADPKATAGSFRPVATQPTGTEVHIAKDDAATMKVMTSMYTAFESHKAADFMPFVSDDTTYNDFSTPAQVKGTKKISDVVAGYNAGFPDFKQSHGLQFTSDGFAIDEGVLTGTHKGALGPIKATNKPVTVHFVDIWQIKDSKIIAGWTYINSLEILVEIGVAPAPGAAPSAAASGSAAPPAASGATAPPKPTATAK